MSAMKQRRDAGSQPSSSVTEGELFERVGPRPYPNGPEPGDRYRVVRPWTTMTGLSAIGRTRGGQNDVAFLGYLRDESLWKRIDQAVLPSMLDVLAEELAVLRQAER